MTDSLNDSSEGQGAPRGGAVVFEGLGFWKVTDRIGASVPNKIVIEVRLAPSSLVVAAEDGGVLGEWPVNQTRYELYGNGRGYLKLGTESLWLTSRSGASGEALRVAIESRRTPEAPAAAPSSLLPWGAGEPPAVLTRQYAGQKTVAAAAMGKDAATLQAYGYVPVTQSYAEGSWGCGAWVLAFLACVFLVGLLIVAYMAINRPDGTLTVVYERRLPAAAAASAASAHGQSAGPASPQAPSIRERLATLDGLLADGLITNAEYAARRAAILESI